MYRPPAMAGGLCPRGAAGRALLTDTERPKTPLLRDGARADQKFMKGGLDLWDPAGGALALQEHFVAVSKVTEENDHK